MDKDYAELSVIYDYCSVLQAYENYEDALYYINKVIEESPLYLRAYERRWYIYCGIGDYDSAIKDIDMLLLIDNSPRNHVYRANTLYSAEKYEEAINEYLYTSDNYSNRKSYCNYSIGQVYYRVSNYEMANQFFEKTMMLGGLQDGDQPNCYREWGDVCYLMAKEEREKGNEKIAVELFEEAEKHYLSAAKKFEKDTDRAFCYYWEGNSYVGIYDYKNAFYCFKKASELDDNRSDYKESLASYESYANEE